MRKPYITPEGRKNVRTVITTIVITGIFLSFFVLAFTAVSNTSAVLNGTDKPVLGAENHARTLTVFFFGNEYNVNLKPFSDITETVRDNFEIIPAPVIAVYGLLRNLFGGL